VTLALGIGANTAIFGLLYGLLLRSLPVQDPNRLAHISIVSAVHEADFEGSFLSYQMFAAYSAEQHSFAELSAWRGESVTIRDREGNVRAYDAGFISGAVFQVLRLKPYLGWPIEPSDDVRGGPSTRWPVVLNYGFWNDRFARDPHIVGKQFTISGVPVTVIGVSSPAFRGIWSGSDIKLFVPIQFETVLTGNDNLNSSNSFFSAVSLDG
jgi:MacB-like periplasmic core domain